MKIVVVMTAFGILLLNGQDGLRLPLVEDGPGDDDSIKAQNLLSIHALEAVGVPETLGDPGLQIIMIEGRIREANENAWLITGNDPANALRTFAKCCPMGVRTYLRAADLLEERLSTPRAA